MNNILPIELDYENLVVKIKDKQGNVLNEYPAIGEMNKSVYYNRDVFQMATKLPLSSKTKEYSKAYTEQYGYTPSTTIKIIDKLRWKMLFGEDQWMTRDQLWRWCRGTGRGGRLIQSEVEWCHNNKELIQQLLADNQENLMPIFRLFSGQKITNTQEMRKFLGKSLWKKIVNNSFTRNNLIKVRMENIIQYSMIVNFTGEGMHDTGVLLEGLNNLVMLPSIYLRNHSPDYLWVAGYTITGKLSKQLKVSGDIESCNSVSDLVHDTRRMFRYLGKEINPDWSYQRWKFEHDKASKEILAAKFSPEPFFKGIYSDSRLVREFEEDGCKAVLLDSPLLVAIEGKEMHHCVGSYVSRCKSGDYLVYSITDKEGKRSTVGIVVCDYQEQHTVPHQHDIPKLREWVMTQQHYGECNSRVSEETKLFSIKLNGKINEELGGGL